MGGFLGFAFIDENEALKRLRNVHIRAFGTMNYEEGIFFKKFDGITF